MIPLLGGLFKSIKTSFEEKNLTWLGFRVTIRRLHINFFIKKTM